MHCTRKRPAPGGIFKVPFRLLHFFAQELGCERPSGGAPGPHALAFGVVDGDANEDEDEEAKREADFQIAAMCGAKVRNMFPLRCFSKLMCRNVISASRLGHRGCNSHTKPETRGNGDRGAFLEAPCGTWNHGRRRRATKPKAAVLYSPLGRVHGEQSFDRKKR
jgi:hypothetical protein